MYEQLKNKKLLVIGSEEVDCNIVNAAHELGIFVFVVDGKTKSKNTPAKLIADESWDIDYTKIEEIGQKCIENHIDGVIAGYSEFRVMAACKIADYINKPFYAKMEQIELTRNKRRFKDECIKYGVKVPRDYCFNSPPSKDESDAISFPVIVKPTDYAGRKGITICDDRTKLNEAIDEALRFSESKTVIVEEYIDGTEFSAIYSLSDGQISLSCFNEKYLLTHNGKKSALCELAVSPSKFLERYIKECDPYVRKFIDGIGARNGVAFFQGIITDTDTYIFEMGYRLNGGNDYVQAELNNNISYMKMLISYALTGKMGDDLAKDNPFFSRIYSTYIMYAKAGTVKSLKCNVNNIKGIDVVHICADPGTVYYDDGTTAQRAFSFKISADTYEETAEIIEAIQNNTQLIDTNNNNMLMGNFDVLRIN